MPTWNRKFCVSASHSCFRSRLYTGHIHGSCPSVHLLGVSLVVCEAVLAHSFPSYWRGVLSHPLPYSCTFAHQPPDQRLVMTQHPTTSQEAPDFFTDFPGNLGTNHSLHKWGPGGALCKM